MKLEDWSLFLAMGIRSLCRIMVSRNNNLSNWIPSIMTTGCDLLLCCSLFFTDLIHMLTVRLYVRRTRLCHGEHCWVGAIRYAGSCRYSVLSISTEKITNARITLLSLPLHLVLLMDFNLQLPFMIPLKISTSVRNTGITQIMTF